jgi:hypothetical protein
LVPKKQAIVAHTLEVEMAGQKAVPSTPEFHGHSAWATASSTDEAATQ